ncbi:hypothetical protein LINGRAHAP2_LOCUS2490 [Linum grandiflorum]
MGMELHDSWLIFGPIWLSSFSILSPDFGPTMWSIITRLTPLGKGLGFVSTAEIKVFYLEAFPQYSSIQRVSGYSAYPNRALLSCVWVIR